MARSLEFSGKVAELADRVIHGMTMAGKYEYNAVHLRIEKDARDWSQIMGGEEVRPYTAHKTHTYGCLLCPHAV